METGEFDEALVVTAFGYLAFLEIRHEAAKLESVERLARSG